MSGDSPHRQQKTITFVKHSDGNIPRYDDYMRRETGMCLLIDRTGKAFPMGTLANKTVHVLKNPECIYYMPPFTVVFLHLADELKNQIQITASKNFCNSQLCCVTH